MQNRKKMTIELGMAKSDELKFVIENEMSANSYGFLLYEELAVFVLDI